MRSRMRMAGWWFGLAVLGAAGGVSAQTYVELGPAPTSGFGGASGRAAALACSRTNPNLYYVGTADGGVWRSTNAGASWTPLTDGLPTTAIGAVALDPSNEQVIYAGSGESNYANHSRYGLGLYKSLDGGANWSVLAAQTFAGRCFSKIIVDPASSQTVYASTTRAGGGPMVAGAKGHPLSLGPTGVFKSVDGGVSWTQLAGGLPGMDCTSLAMDPSDHLTLYAGIGTPYGSAGNGIYKTTNGGQSWTQLTNGLPTDAIGRVEVATAPTDRNRLYAMLVQAVGGIGVGGSASGGGALRAAARSIDGGATWTTIPLDANLLSTQGFYNCVISVSPSSADVVFFCGVNVVRSDNGGTTFTGNLASHHPDHHAACWDAAGRLVVGNDGGVGRTANLGQSFTPLNAGLGSIQFYAGISTHPTNDAVIFGGLQDNGTVRRESSSPIWTAVFGGDGGWTQVDQTDPNRVFVEFQGTGNLFRSTSGGGAGSFAGVGSGLSGRHCFLPPHLIDSRTPGRMLYATERVWRSLDGGSTFTALSPDLTLGGNAAIRAMALAPSDSNYVYVATNDSRVLSSSDGGATFSLKRSDALGWPRITREIAVDERDPRTAYLAGARFGLPHVRRTRDAGDSWTTLDGDLPDVPVNVIAIDNRFPTPRIYAGTDAGLWLSRNDGAGWRRYGAALPNVAVIDLKLEVGRDRKSVV